MCLEEYDRFMRRAEREITDPSEISSILLRGRVVHLGVAAAAGPYVVPLCYGYDASRREIVFHTAISGRKLDLWMADPRVGFEIDCPLELLAGGDRACAWGLAYESVIGSGVVSEILETEAKIEALRLLMRQQTGESQAWTFRAEPVNSTRLWRLTIDAMSGKRCGPLGNP
ncbi:MAG: pyridoxamine 5'-phosphate oxidase family protein [Candidatus Bipolaricaulota bacterium]